MRVPYRFEDCSRVLVEQQRIRAAGLEYPQGGDGQPNLHALADESAAMAVSRHETQLSIPQPSNDRPLPISLFVQTAPL